MQSTLMPADTSASVSFAGLSNGTLSGATDVSKINVHSLLYPGNTTKVLVHYLPWFDGGMDTGINVNYSNANPTYINSFFADIVSRGVDGVMVDWQGQTDISDKDWLVSQPLIHNYTTLSGDKLTFAIMLDANLLNNASGTNQAKVLAAMNYINAQYLKDPSYLTYNGKPVVGDFGLTAASGIDWTAIQNAYPNVQFVHLDNATSPDGFNIPKSGGSFLWVNPTSQDVVPPDLSSMDDFYTRANLHPTEITMGGAYKGFNSQYASWDGQQYVDQQCGQTWLNSFTKINQYYNSAKQLPFLQLVTWDDYYEGTPLETGVDNCLTLNTSASGRTITVSPSNTSTLDHLELWSFNNSAWSQVSYPANTTTIPVTAAGTYYVKAVGKPFIKNTLSSAITVN
ncbi:hypothetical protein GXB81_14165 [Paraburkholderia sp. Ac-20336]|uniref:hypothetical protein n=1 Tax=Burkholderiaceae TaxID=119060 RepID=UPI00141F92CE|nr:MULTISPECIES: hypothetical protein [Burkholderiaceae]MBN3804186.1 hypothetical protein [Paraburkholderia sp. Ac-20336]NIF50739.1 hypothetical protein [Burkholderia sp. Ax-1724]NIF76593.1 hypothetical protein [Paraburkholderia sp. Cy-641]